MVPSWPPVGSTSGSRPQVEASWADSLPFTAGSAWSPSGVSPSCTDGAAWVTSVLFGSVSANAERSRSKSEALLYPPGFMGLAQRLWFDPQEQSPVLLL